MANFPPNQTVKRQATDQIAASFQGIRNEDCKMGGSMKNYSGAWVSRTIRKNRKYLRKPDII